MQMAIDFDEILEHAERLVREAATLTGLTGPEKRQQAAKRLAQWADGQVNPKGVKGRILDALDDVVWLALAEVIIEFAYRGLFAEGEPL